MPKSNKKAGFTLIELVIVIVLTAIIATIASKLLSQGLTAYLTGKNITDANWQGRLALERMSRDLRAIPSVNNISAATANQFSFTDANNNTVSYSLSSNQLLLGSNVLADGIQSLTFTYYDANGNTTSSITSIKFIKITLVVTQGGTNFTLTTSINPRNLLT